MSVTHVFDTSALLAHYFGEPGAEELDRVWADPDNEIGICVLSLPELKTRLSAEVDDPAEIARAFQAYADKLTVSLQVDRMVAERAIELREASRGRLPLVDSVIAATASCQSAILVHCDRHMAGIPEDRLRQRFVGPAE
ncbi:MAG: type II toxin-antitoxin system VapC family toxin [Acidobacteriota bacterium]